MSREFTWDGWVKTLDVPLYRGYYIPDLRTLELGWWERRGCHTAFVQLAGQEGICEARVSEIPPGGSLPAFQLAIDEVVYVLAGRGITNVWSGGQRKSFEWQPHSLFMLPRHCRHELHNLQGSQPVRLLHYNYLPLGMSVIADPEFFFHDLQYPHDIGDSLYSEAKLVLKATEDAAPGNRANLIVRAVATLAANVTATQETKISVNVVK